MSQQDLYSEVLHSMKQEKYKNLFNSSLSILKKYSYDYLIEGFTVDLINLLLINHIEKVKQADTKEKLLNLMNDSVHQHYGLQINLADFIEDHNDKEQLFRNFAEWRSLLLGNQ